MTVEERFLVTGAMGCIGAWVIRVLLNEGTSVVGFDLSADARRLRLIATPEEIERVRFVTGDLTDSATMLRVVASESITHVVHLAGLQIPFCQADPIRGAQVNVVGTINIFEAVLANRDQVRGLAYASSAAVFGPSDLYPNGIVADDSPLSPSANLYGVYKQANEWTARVYAETQGIGSVGLRPFVAYGPGRDQGRTSSPSVAMLAAAAGVPYRMNFGGYCTMQYAEDVARIFIEAARTGSSEALTLNIGGRSVSMSEIIAAIEAAAPEARGSLTYDDVSLPFAARVDSTGLTRLLDNVPETSLTEGVRRSIETFRGALAQGLLSPPPYAAR